MSRLATAVFVFWLTLVEVSSQNKFGPSLLDIQMPLTEALGVYHQIAGKVLIIAPDVTTLVNPVKVTLRNARPIPLAEFDTWYESKLREQANIVFVPLDQRRMLVAPATAFWLSKAEAGLEARPAPCSKRSVRQAVQAYVEGTGDEQTEAFLTLVRAGPTAEPLLVEGLQKPQGFRLKERQFYAWLWPRLPISLQKHLRGPNAYNVRRQRCADLLGCLDPISAGGIKALVQALVDRTDGTAGVSTCARRSLQAILEREDRVPVDIARALPELNTNMAHASTGGGTGRSPASDFLVGEIERQIKRKGIAK